MEDGQGIGPAIFGIFAIFVLVLIAVLFVQSQKAINTATNTAKDKMFGVSKEVFGQLLRKELKVELL